MIVLSRNNANSCRRETVGKSPGNCGKSDTTVAFSVTFSIDDRRTLRLALEYAVFGP